MLDKLIDPDLLPVYEALYNVLTAFIISLILVTLLVLIFLYLPSHEAMSHLEEANKNLQKLLSKTSNHAAVMTIELNRKDGRARNAKRRAAVFAREGDKFRKQSSMSRG